MFGDFIGEKGATVGTGDYELGGIIAGSTYQLWRSQFVTDAPLFYLATTRDASKREIGYGTFTQGTPDRITRNVLRSTQADAVVNWANDDVYYIFSVPVGTALAAMLDGALGKDAPAWLPSGALRWDAADDLGALWRRLVKTPDGEVELGRHYVAEGFYSPSPRRKWVDAGANSIALTAEHIGQVILLDVDAADRTLTLPAGSSDDIGDGYECHVLGYGSPLHGVILDPDAGDPIDAGADGVTLKLPAGRLTRLAWDAARSQWQTDYLARQIATKGLIYGWTLANNATDATNDVDIAAGGGMDDTNTVLIQVGALTKRLDATFAAGTDQGFLDTGAIDNSAYDVYAIAKGDGTGDYLACVEGDDPVLPTGYIYKRKINWIKRASSALLKVAQSEISGGGIATRWLAPSIDVAAVAISATQALYTLNVPLSVIVKAEINTRVSAHNLGGVRGTFYEVGTTPQSTMGNFGAEMQLNPNSTAVGDYVGYGRYVLWTSSSGQIAAIASATGQVSIETIGFEWLRR